MSLSKTLYQLLSTLLARCRKTKFLTVYPYTSPNEYLEYSYPLIKIFIMFIFEWAFHKVFYGI